MNVFNIQTGETETPTPDEIAIGLAQGVYAPPEGQGVLFNPSGELVFTPSDQVSDAIQKYGYKIPQPDELQSLGESFKYTTLESQAKAFGAGAARGATFGASDSLATQSGLADPETLRKLKEFNPETSIAGELKIGRAHV